MFTSGFSTIRYHLHILYNQLRLNNQYLGFFCACLCSMLGVGLYQKEVIPAFWPVYSIWCLLTVFLLFQMAIFINTFFIQSAHILDLEHNLNKFITANQELLKLNEIEKEMLNKNPNSKVVTFILEDIPKLNMTNDELKILIAENIKNELEKRNNEVSH